MSKIATYSLADSPLQLSDRLIGTEAPRPTPSATPLATKNFSLGELLQLFSSEFPAPALQGVLDTGNTATQDINLTGTITSTLIKPTNIVDMLNSEGTPLQVLSKGVGGICWIDAPSGGSAIWGDITGTLTNQTDLIDYLDSNYYPLSSNPAGYISQESVLEFPTFGDFPITGASNTIYIAADTRIGYYWNGSAYVTLTTSTSGITGFGAVDYIAKFTPNGSTIGSSGIIESNGRVAINYSFRPLISGGTILSIQRAQSQIDFILGNPGTGPSSSASFMLSDNEINGFEIGSKGEFAIKTGSTYSNEGIRVFSSGKLKFTQTPDAGSTSDFILLRDTSGNVKQIAYPDFSGFVPYIGATTDVDLGGFSIVSTFGGVDYYTGFNHNGFFSLDNIAGNAVILNPNEISLCTNGLSISGHIKSDLLTTIDKLYQLPNQSGTFALLSDIPSVTGFVPYTGATSNVDLGEYELKAGQLSLDTSPTGTASVGTTRWNNTIGSSETTLKGGTVLLKNGVDLVARVINKVTPNTTLLRANYAAVRVSGAQGQRLAVAYARANSDANSADTIGLVCEDIATNQEGFIITVGELSEINTTGSLQGETWVDGDVLYLSPTTAGAITNIKPTGLTGHIVVIGYVEYAHSVHGSIYVKIMNGWELDELHNVYINPATLANNDVLQYVSADQLWENKALTTASVAASTNKNYVTDAQSSLLGTISQSGLTAYTGTITWSGTTAPSGTTNFSYNWTKIGNQVTLNITLLYGTVGTSNTSVVMTLPSGAPTPVKPTGLTNASEKLYQGSGKITQNTTGTLSNANECALRSNSANNGFEIVMTQTSINAKLVNATIIYFTA